jgi:hypothetical protein
MKGLFDPVVAEITNLLAQQVEDVKRTKNAYIDVFATIVKTSIFKPLLIFYCLPAHHPCWWILRIAVSE